MTKRMIQHKRYKRKPKAKKLEKFTLLHYYHGHKREAHKANYQPKKRKKKETYNKKPFEVDAIELRDGKSRRRCCGEEGPL